MASENSYYDGFDYNSSQDYVEIEYQIDLFEIRQCSKAKKQNKQKMRIPSYPISRKTLKSQHPLIKIYGIDHKKTSEIEQKIFRYTRYLPEKDKNEIKIFECDKQFLTKSDHTQSNLSLQTVRPADFTTFRRHFYSVNHQQIKSSLKHQSNLEIINIRLAPIDKSVQNDFMERFNENSLYYPDLVYHGTKLTNIKSVLQYGFLIPNQSHPTNSKAPIIATQNGSAYGSGIYCSETADYSLSYSNTTNTLLVCAALPKRNEAGLVQRSHGNILVLSHVSEIIPLFLIDFRYLNESSLNQPWFNKRYSLKMNVVEDANKPLIILRKYLRKVLNYTKDQQYNRILKQRAVRAKLEVQGRISRESKIMADTILKLGRGLVQIDTNKDFLSDQIHYQITFTVLIISAFASTSLQFYADPIQCIQPAQFTDGYTSFAKTLCWLNNTYFYPQTYTRIPMNKNERLQHTLHYYQWLPFIYLIQAFFFILPHLIWISFYKRNGSNPGTMVNQGKKFDKNPEISERIAKEIERYLMCRRLAQFKKKLLFRHNDHHHQPHETSDSPLLLPNISIRVRYHSYYLVTLYLIIKLLYIINIILQVAILNVILSTGNYGFFRFGFDTIKYLFHSSIRERITELSYKHQQLFPFVTLCDFNIRELGQDHYYTIECILLINIFYEKIYFAMWIWFAILFLMSIFSFIHAFYNYFPFFARYRFVSKLLRFARSKKQQTLTPAAPILQYPTTTEVRDVRDEHQFLIDVNRRKEFVHWLQRDGVFLLHLLNSHAGGPLTVKCLEHLMEIWVKNYEEKSKLAERLLHNRFNFSK